MPTRVCSGARGLEPSHRRDQLQPRPYRPLGVILMRLRIAEIDEHAVAHVFRHEAAKALHSLGDAFLIGRNDLAQILRVDAGGECRRTDQVREHHRDLAALGGVFRGRVDCRKSVGWRRFRACISAQGSDSVEQLTAVPDNADAEVLQVLRRQARQDRLVNLVLAEYSLILFEAKAPQPTTEVHDSARTQSGAYDHPGETGCLGARSAFRLAQL